MPSPIGTNPSWLEIAVRRAREDSWTLGAALEEYCRMVGVTQEQLSSDLGCSADSLAWMSLCRRPSPERFADDVSKIAERFQVDALKLARIIKRVESVPVTVESAEERIVFPALSNPVFLRNFLERFLVAAGRLLGLPWWAVHLGLYLAVGIASAWFINVHELYPNGGYVSFGAERVAEFIFTAFMLWHVRKCRRAALLAAARLTSGKDQLIWLREYLAPVSWGWVARLGERQWNIRVWSLNAALLTAYWGSQFIYYRSGWLKVPHSRYYWAIYYPYPQLLYIYPTIAKAAMAIAGAAQFWWLRGQMLVVRGRYPSNFTAEQKNILYQECGRAATQFSLGVTVAIVIWVLARALAYGFTFWAYLYSLCLLVVFAGQIAIVTDARFPWLSGRFLRQLIAPDFAVDWQFEGFRRFATLSPVWGLLGLIVALGPLAQVVGALKR